ncbi:MAG: hypothetical protein ABI759_04195 [Candidatus Solibacter sp.]
MTASGLVEQLASTRQQLDFAGSLLLKPSPEALDECSTILEATGRQLAQWQPEFAREAGNAAAMEEAWRLRRSFQRTSRLLQGAADFHFNWLRARGAITGGYTGTGDSAPLQHGSRICLEG